MKTVLVLIMTLTVQIANALNLPPTSKEAAYFYFKNKTVNPGFENGTSQWTASGGSFTITTSAANVGEGGQSAVFNASAASQTLSGTNYAVERALRGSNGYAKCEFRTTATDYTLQVHDGTNIVATRTIGTSAEYTEQGVNFVFPTSGNVRLRVISGSDAADLFMDDCYLGPAPNIHNVAQSTLVASAFKAGTTNCSWTLTSTTFTDFGTDADCPAITIDQASGVGSVVTTDDDLPQIVINSLPPGTYKVTATFIGASLVATNQYFRISDGTTGRGEQDFTIGASAAANYALSATFTYGTAGNRTFKIQARQDTGATFLGNDNANRRLQFIVERLPSTPEIVANINTQNYGWTAFTPTTQGFGTTTSNECFHARDGEDMLIRCKLTTGTPTAVEARLTLPNGLTSKSTAFIPTIQNVGQWARGVASSSNYGGILIEPGVTYVTFGAVYAAAANPFTKLNGTGVVAGGDIVNITARVPIAEWTNSQPVPVFVGGVSATQALAPYAIASVTFGGASEPQNCTASPCTINRQSGAVASVTRGGTGNYTINFTAGAFSGIPMCVGSGLQVGTGGLIFEPGGSVPTATAYTFNSRNTALSGTDGYWSVLCWAIR